MKDSNEYAPTVMLITLVYIVLSLPLMHDYTNGYMKQIPIFPGVPTRHSLIVHTILFMLFAFIILLTDPSSGKKPPKVDEKRNITMIPFE